MAVSRKRWKIKPRLLWINGEFKWSGVGAPVDWILKQMKILQENALFLPKIFTISWRKLKCGYKNFRLWQMYGSILVCAFLFRPLFRKCSLLKSHPYPFATYSNFLNLPLLLITNQKWHTLFRMRWELLKITDNHYGWLSQRQLGFFFQYFSFD